MNALGSSALIPPESGAAEQSRRELQARLAGIGGLNGPRLTPEAKAKKLREACEGFESVFIQKMWQEMRNTIPKGGLMHGKEERFWQDMYDQELSKSMTSAGGIGLADMMYAQLSRNLVSASRSAAGASQGTAFAPQAAPLLPPAPAADAAPETAATGRERAAARPVAVPAGIYDGEAPNMGDAGNTGLAPGETAAASMTSAAPSAAVAGHPKPSAGQSAAEPDAPAANPVVEQALAALRAAQARHRGEAAGQDATPQGASRPHTAQAQAPKTHHESSRNPLASSGIELAQMARREAGDKLGPGAVRPALHQTQQRHAQHREPEQSAGEAGLRQTGVAQAGAEQAGTGQGAEQARAADAARPRTVRYTTNIPPKERARRGLKPIRVLNVDNVGVNSKAGAGLAAWHAARAENEARAQQAGPGAAPQAPGIMGASSTPEAGPQQTGAVPPLTAANAQPASGPQATEQASGTQPGFAIPPLTAADARG